MNTNQKVQYSGGMPKMKRHSGGFSLVELLTVVAILSVVMVMAIPALSSLKGGMNVTNAAYEIKGILDQARTYAIANNTFVWVGFFEEDGSQAPTTPAISGTGRIVIATVASKDGTRGYDITSTSLPTPPWTNSNNGSNLTPIERLHRFENIRLAAPGVLNGSGISANANGSVGTGGMQRPGISSSEYVVACGTGAASSVTQFAWPAGQNLGTGQYQFKTVINFDPQGICRIQYASNNDAVAKYLEVGLQLVQGQSVQTNNVAAIQIDGMTGATKLYRP
jgi:prepilin-type N-terminal cleavage/methylation domain-containing protein